MSKAVRRVRTPVFFTASVARRVDALVLELGCSRSAIIRAAVDRGLGAAAKDLRRDHENRLRDVGTPPRARRSESAPSGLLPIEDAVSKLTVFGEGVRIAGERPEPTLFAMSFTLMLAPFLSALTISTLWPRRWRWSSPEVRMPATSRPTGTPTFRPTSRRLPWRFPVATCSRLIGRSGSGSPVGS